MAARQQTLRPGHSGKGQREPQGLFCEHMGADPAQLFELLKVVRRRTSDGSVSISTVSGCSSSISSRMRLTITSSSGRHVALAYW
jgi:hypothetical protein